MLEVGSEMSSAALSAILAKGTPHSRRGAPYRGTNAPFALSLTTRSARNTDPLMLM